MRAVLLVSVFSLAGAAIAIPAAAQSACGVTEELEPGETVAEMADRCGVTVEAILDANDVPAVENLDTSTALALPLISDETAERVEEVGEQAVEGMQDAGEQAAETLENAGETVREEGPDWLARAREAVEDAGKRIEEGAEAAGRSASEYLSANPDLNQDIIRFGERIGLPGVESQPERGPWIEAVPAQDGKVALSGAGLPGDTEVVIALQSAGGMEEIDRVRTEDDGTLSVTLDLPETMPEGESARFVIETADQRMRLAADPYPQP